MTRAVLFLLMSLLAGCSGTSVINALSPSSHYDRIDSLRYADGPRGTLDLYLPKRSTYEAPLVVFFYGGGWKDGSKEQYEFVASSLTRQGFVVAIPDYRLYPDVVFPAFVEDGAAAIRYLRAQLEARRHAPSALFLMGHSAGAHIAALLTLDERYLADLHMPVTAFVGLAGPYDFLPIESGYLEEVFPEALRQDSQPINFVSSCAPPTLLLHGVDDEVVRLQNSESLAARYRSSGAPVMLEIYDGTNHAGLAAELAPPLDFLGTALEDAVMFLREHSEAAMTPAQSGCAAGD